MGPVPQRPVSTASARTAAATAVPACSISRSSDTPSAWARRSAPVIASAPIAGIAARSAQRVRRARRSISKSAGSFAGRDAAAPRSGAAAWRSPAGSEVEDMANQA